MNSEFQYGVQADSKSVNKGPKKFGTANVRHAQFGTLIGYGVVTPQ